VTWSIFRYRDYNTRSIRKIFLNILNANLWAYFLATLAELIISVVWNITFLSVISGQQSKRHNKIAKAAFKKYLVHWNTSAYSF
jgi:hypothetical protein